MPVSKSLPYEPSDFVGIRLADPYITCVGKGSSFVLRYRTLEKDL